MEALFEGDPPSVDRSALRDVHAAPEQWFSLLQDIQALLEQAAPSMIRCSSAWMTCNGLIVAPQRCCAAFRSGLQARRWRGFSRRDPARVRLRF
jgi:hypothetical protein